MRVIYNRYTSLARTPAPLARVGYWGGWVVFSLTACVQIGWVGGPPFGSLLKTQSGYFVVTRNPGPRWGCWAKMLKGTDLTEIPIEWMSAT